MLYYCVVMKRHGRCTQMFLVRAQLDRRKLAKSSLRPFLKETGL